MTTYYYADCDQFDNCRTSWHRTPEGAVETFWSENCYSEAESKRIQVYTREVVDPTPEEWSEERETAEELGLISVTREDMAQYAR
jgi:hypothetical protein